MTAALPYRLRRFRLRLLRLLVLAAVGWGTGACAASGAQAREDTPAKVPPEVSDHSVGPDAVDDVAVRPRVAVSLENDTDADLHTTGARKYLTRSVRRCYRLALGQNRALEGSLVYEVLVTSNGRFGGAEKMSTSAPNKRLEDCVETVLQRLRFDVSDSPEATLHRVYVRMDFRREIFDPNRPPVGAKPGAHGED